MGITRTTMAFERDFTQIPNAWLRDERLSRRARGLLAELMTHRAGWHITIAGLQKAGPEGRDAIRGAVLELAECGYLIRRQTQGAKGRFNEIEYQISDPTARGESTAYGKSDTGGFTDDGPADDGSADVGGSAPKNTSHEEDHLEEENLEEHPSSPSAREIESEFDRAYASWPKKVERKRSLEAFKRAVKKRGVEELVADVIRFGETYRASTDPQYVPALCVWLRGERWTDDLPAPKAPSDAEWGAFLAEEDIRDGFLFRQGKPVIGGPDGMNRAQYDAWVDAERAKGPGHAPTRGEENLAYLQRVMAEERSEAAGRSRASGRSTPDDRFQQTLERGQRLAALADQARHEPEQREHHDHAIREVGAA